MIDPKNVKKVVDAYAKTLCFNRDLLDIFQNNLAKYIIEEIRKQMSIETAAFAIARLSPINILPKVIDKLTNIYQTPVIREMNGGTEKDQKILDFYEKEMKVNSAMDRANEIFNLTNGACLVQPFLYKKKPRLRAIKPDTYVPYSDDPTDPTIPTDIILVFKGADDKPYYWVYNAFYIYCCDEDGNYLNDKMMANGMYDELTGTVNTVNPLGTIPFVYINSSGYCIAPSPDEDGLQIIKLLPVMLTDLNYAAMFQSFSIVYGINVDEEDLPNAPNAFWRFKKDPTTDASPTIGVLKPEVDYSQVLSLIESQLSMWLGTKGIRASSIGKLGPENIASGISKIIDEMDTYEAREKQVIEFQGGEEQLWDLTLQKLNPYWIATGQMDNVGIVTPTATVSTKFTTQLPLQTRGQVVIDLKTEVEAGFISQRGAIKMLNPDLTDKEIDELIAEIEAEIKPLPKGNANGLAENELGNPGGPNPDATAAAS